MKKKLIIMNSFCNRYMCDGYTNMFYQCYYIDMIWKNQKLIFFCRWKQTGNWWGHHVELNISRRILTGCKCLFKCSLLLKLLIFAAAFAPEIDLCIFHMDWKKNHGFVVNIWISKEEYLFCVFSVKKKTMTWITWINEQVD